MNPLASRHGMSAVGYRDPRETISIPDVVLTGDEFLHVMAIVGETLPGEPPCHAGPDVSRGFWKPGCAACKSIMLKAERLMEECTRLGYRA